MKKILFLFLITPCFCFAQAKVLTKDTTWQTNANGNFYEVRQVEYSNGESSLVTTLIGDTTTIFNSYLTGFISEGTQMANDAYKVIRFADVFDGMASRRDLVLQITGRDILDTLAVRYSGALLASGWTITANDVETDIAFSITAATQLRYQVTGFPQRNAFVVANTMRLVNYLDSGKNIDIFKMPGGNWVDITGKIKMKFPGNVGLKRTVKAAIEAPVKVEAAKKKKSKN